MGFIRNHHPSACVSTAAGYVSCLPMSSKPAADCVPASILCEYGYPREAESELGVPGRRLVCTAGVPRPVGVAKAPFWPCLSSHGQKSIHAGLFPSPPALQVLAKSREGRSNAYSPEL